MNVHERLREQARDINRNVSEFKELVQVHFRRLEQELAGVLRKMMTLPGMVDDDTTIDQAKEMLGVKSFALKLDRVELVLRNLRLNLIFAESALLPICIDPDNPENPLDLPTPPDPD